MTPTGLITLAQRTGAPRFNELGECPAPLSNIVSVRRKVNSCAVCFGSGVLIPIHFSF